MQIRSLSTANDRLFGRKGASTHSLNSFLLFSSGVLSALQNSWEATSLDICWLFHVALCGGLCCCATHFHIQLNAKAAQ